MVQKIAYKEFELEYKLFGSGSEFIIAFHGFGREANDFKIFEKNLGEKFTIVAVNLYHHGNSVYPDNRMFDNQISKQEFIEHLEVLLNELKIYRFSIMGYSLGGRVALTCIQHFYARINKIILIAPDGLKTSHYNNFVTRTNMGKNYIKWVIKKPEEFFGLIDRLHSYKIVNNRTKRMINFHFETHEKRVLLRNVISSFKNIVPNISEVTHHINNYNIEIVMVFGRHDFIIPIKLGIRFLKGIRSKKQLHIIDASHNILTENASKTLSELIR
jgi:pimeloyl-ACP methyl ester carboxylesterase